MLVCKILGCEKEVVAKKLCSVHYKRLQRHGDPLKGRPSTWGLSEKHPLYNRWAWFRRQQQLCEDWLDFWQFVKDIGEVKSNSTLRRKDITKNISLTNYYWKEAVFDTNRNKRQKQYRDANPERIRNTDLKRRFGITLEEYNVTLEKQGGVCAICSEKDPVYENLAVDHDHNTNKIRGLLCHLCNRGLGLFKDDITRLEKALKYLKC